jgi:hypothetical protein
MICATEDCENYTEGSTPYCGSCNHAIRKAEKEANKIKAVQKIKKVSAKQSKKNRLYTTQRIDFLTQNPLCQMRLQGCTIIATTVHHTEKRGENTNKVESFMGACGNCHDLVETKLSAVERREKGFLK